ncbi:uncharacterized protein LOC143279559 [Babylonia areolata]|uniref:uncharacterized protein LOC143279559 n=1 Tax=Babylonia areolata TaxID=304850 RepID=UPI003FD3EDA0
MRPSVPLLFSLTLIPILSWADHQEQDSGSGCPDQQDLCMDEGSGSGFGSGDVSFDPPRGTILTAVCRGSGLVTWGPVPAVAVDKKVYNMIKDCPLGEGEGEEEEETSDVASRCHQQLQQQGGSPHYYQHNQHMTMDEMSLLLPVTSASTNLTYFNRYCFLCARDPGPGLTWRVNVSCSSWVDLQSQGSERDVLKAALDSRLCAMELQPPPGSPTEECRHKPPGDLSMGEGRSHKSAISVLLSFRDLWAKDSAGQEAGGGQGGGGGGRGEGHHNDSSSSTSSSWCTGYVVRRFGEERCLSLSCAPGKRLVNKVGSSSSGGGGGGGTSSTCQPVIGRVRGLHYSLTLLLHVFVARHGDDTSRILTSGSSSPSPCSLEELAKAGVTQKTSRLHTRAYNLTGWVLSARHQQQHATTLTSRDDALYDDVDDLYFERSEATSDEQPQEPPDNVTSQTAGKEFRLGQVLIWFDFFVTSDTDMVDLERSAVRTAEEEWHVPCGNTQARLVPVRKTRGDDIVVLSLNDSTSQEVDPFPTAFTESATHADYMQMMGQKQNSVAVTVSPHLICPFLTFARGEITTGQFFAASQGDGRAMVNLTLMNVTQAVLSSDIDVDKEGNVKICRRLFEEKFWKWLKDRNTRRYDSEPEESSFWALVEHYMSLVCVCLSMVCLLATIVTYSTFRTLRSIPGQNTLALCCNLFVAQGLLQFGVGGWGEPRGVGCMALGMLIHYFWLASVLWMNVSSFHMHRVFTATRPAVARTSGARVRCCTRRVVSYAVYAQGVPLVVIGATVSTAIFLSQGLQIGYGGEVCYLSSPLLVGAAFAAPLGVVLLLNLGFFLGAVKAITKSDSSPALEAGPLQNGHGRRRPDSPDLQHAAPFPSPWRRNLNVCIRLSSLTGLFWALGLIAELLDQRVLRMVSVMVNGSQGVLIAASYLLTRRVRRLYSRLCCPCQGGRQQSASLNSPASSSSPSHTGGNTAVSVTSTPVLLAARDRGARFQHNSDM